MREEDENEVDVEEEESEGVFGSDVNDDDETEPGLSDASLSDALKNFVAELSASPKLSQIYMIRKEVCKCGSGKQTAQNINRIDMIQATHFLCCI